MTTPAYFADNIDRQDITDRIPTQWQAAARLHALIDGLLNLVERELVAPLRQIEAYRNPDRAQGVWLDREELNCPRIFITTTSAGFFNFGTPFGRPLVGQTEYRILDDDYRGLLTMCARMLYGDASLPSLQWQARGLFPNARYTDLAPGVRADLNATADQLDLARVMEERLPRAPGLPITVVP